MADLRAISRAVADVEVYNLPELKRITSLRVLVAQLMQEPLLDVRRLGCGLVSLGGASSIPERGDHILLDDRPITEATQKDLRKMASRSDLLRSCVVRFWMGSGEETKAAYAALSWNIKAPTSSLMRSFVPKWMYQKACVDGSFCRRCPKETTHWHCYDECIPVSIFKAFVVRTVSRWTGIQRDVLVQKWRLPLWDQGPANSKYWNMAVWYARYSVYCAAVQHEKKDVPFGAADIQQQWVSKLTECVEVLSRRKKVAEEWTCDGMWLQVSADGSNFSISPRLWKET